MTSRGPSCTPPGLLKHLLTQPSVWYVAFRPIVLFFPSVCTLDSKAVFRLSIAGVATLDWHQRKRQCCINCSAQLRSKALGVAMLPRHLSDAGDVRPQLYRPLAGSEPGHQILLPKSRLSQACNALRVNTCVTGSSRSLSMVRRHPTPPFRFNTKSSLTCIDHSGIEPEELRATCE